MFPTRLPERIVMLDYAQIILSGVSEYSEVNRNMNVTHKSTLRVPYFVFKKETLKGAALATNFNLDI